MSWYSDFYDLISCIFVTRSAHVLHNIIMLLTYKNIYVEMYVGSIHGNWHRGLIFFNSNCNVYYLSLFIEIEPFFCSQLMSTQNSSSKVSNLSSFHILLNHHSICLLITIHSKSLLLIKLHKPNIYMHNSMM